MAYRGMHWYSLLYVMLLSFELLLAAVALAVFASPLFGLNLMPLTWLVLPLIGAQYLFIGFTGNWLYQRHAKRKITVISLKTSPDRLVKKIAAFRSISVGLGIAEFITVGLNIRLLAALYFLGIGVLSSFSLHPSSPGASTKDVGTQEAPAPRSVSSGIAHQEQTIAKNAEPLSPPAHSAVQAAPQAALNDQDQGTVAECEEISAKQSTATFLEMKCGLNSDVPKALAELYSKRKCTSVITEARREQIRSEVRSNDWKNLNASASEPDFCVANKPFYEQMAENLAEGG